ncbi:MAG: bifunctional oligoribonuclease/PAP phosphatase NrnA [Calditrichaceae bacterium]|nr:bifunctional oligoribonuclease/PAP phosphatase NrnA [Calditrichaceae bacterium]MBN2709121.1 bifunctional oligoribonuclease/PAP phosphatase NrnA [Calditrichaceae bacterium]RQV96076.1 MAG: bifunctional oligoribonuclease/PAP phosphatase NrnA [Calditrichota bacterium]
MKADPRHIKFAKEILEFIRENDHFLVSAHINADGDAVASVIAMHLFLKHLGKTTYMALSDQEIDHRLHFLSGIKEIKPYSEVLKQSLKPQIHAAVLLDVPSYSRLGVVSELLPDKSRIVKIDHHPQEDNLGAIEWVDEGASSTAAMVYEILEYAKVKFTPEMADAVYTGIVYDTGRFSFSNTTARDMYICSRMIESGVKPSEITNRLFFENSFKALKIIGKGLYSLENYLDGAVNVIYLSLDDMNQSDHGEIEELANYSVAIRGGEVGLFIREVKPGFHKISFRSKGKVDVNHVAKAFGGGGHARAAGCRIDGTRDEIISSIIKEIATQLS